MYIKKYSTILIQLWQKLIHFRWPVPQNLPRRGAVWSRTVARRWTTRRCRELCATTTAANGRAGRDIWQWWKRRDSTTSKSFRSYIYSLDRIFVLEKMNTNNFLFSDVAILLKTGEKRRWPLWSSNALNINYVVVGFVFGPKNSHLVELELDQRVVGRVWSHCVSIFWWNLDRCRCASNDNRKLPGIYNSC